MIVDGLTIVFGMGITARGGTAGRAGAGAGVLAGNADGLGRKLETVMRSGR